jgi:uncharacterized protein (DUF1015 family)
MAILHPFRAIRPVRDKVHLVATRPYYSYKNNVLKAKIEDNPYTLLHIINPEFNKTVKTSPNSRERFSLVKKGYDLFLEKGVLIQDAEPQLYLYRQTGPDRSYTGIIGGADAEDYLNDVIKKHEATLTAREAVFTEYLEVVGLNAEPVLMSYQGNERIDAVIASILVERPEYEFSTTDLNKHELWIIDLEKTQALVKYFEQIPATYIADGHHRSASSVAYYLQEKSNGNSGKGRKFLCYYVQEKDLKILEFQRLAKHLNGQTREEFLKQLEKWGNLQKLRSPRKPQKKHEITIYLEYTCYSLTLNESMIQKDHPTLSLDAELLTQWILQPVLHIEDLKTSQDISFVPGNTPFNEVLNRVNDGTFSVAFFLFPVTMEEVKKVADHGTYMPPKSTWVEPKLRSGLTIMNLHD